MNGVHGVVAADGPRDLGLRRPYNPGNILGFEPVDADGQQRTTARAPASSRCTTSTIRLRRIAASRRSGVADQTASNSFLNFDASEGVPRPRWHDPECGRTQTSTYPTMH